MPKPKYNCGFCDSEWSMDHYRQNVDLELMSLTLVAAKVCNKHAVELQEAITKKELEMQIA